MSAADEAFAPERRLHAVPDQDLADGYDLDVGGHRWIRAVEDWTAWMRAAGMREGTITLRRCQLRRLAEAHLRRSPWTVTAGDLVTWLAEQQWAPETRHSYRSALRVFYRWACETGRTGRNPAAGLPRVHVPPALPRPAPEQVLTDALEVASACIRLILLLAAYAGLRRAEISALRWADLTAAGIRVVGKGGRVRVVPLHIVLARELAAEHARRQAGLWGTGWRYGTAGDGAVWVFPGQRPGSHQSASAIGQAATKALPAGWTGHTLRHRFLTRAYQASHDLLVVQALAGHAHPETTLGYTQLADGRLADVVHAIS